MAMPVVKCIPLMYHPTNVVLLDDDRKFLHELCMCLALDVPYVEDSDPQKIMKYLEAHTYKQNSLSSLMIKPVFDKVSVTPSSANVYSVDLSSMIVDLKSPDRFKISAHGMFDRAMKKVDGITFCRTIRQKDIVIKIHLFTGKTNSEEAIEFFNQKLIDGFLAKEEDYVELAKKVNELVQGYRWQFFIDLSEKLIGLLSHEFKSLHDEQFINIFMRIFEKYKIVEFYICDAYCSFLMIDANGKAKQLFVRDRDAFKVCYEIAENAEAPRKVLQAIKDHQMFPYVGGINAYDTLKADQWEASMIEMERVPGRELYYAVIDRPDIKVFSFDRYMKEEWPKP